MLLADGHWHIMMSTYLVGSTHKGMQSEHMDDISSTTFMRK